MPGYTYSIASLSRVVRNACLSFWGKHPHQWQEQAVSTWLDQIVPVGDTYPTVNLLCRATGGGKSLTFQTFGAVTGGVVLVIVPSLSLAADQVSKIDNCLDDTVPGVHLDDVTSTVDRARVTSILSSLTSDSDQTVFIFASPQAIISDVWLPSLHGLNTFFIPPTNRSHLNFAMTA